MSTAEAAKARISPPLGRGDALALHAGDRVLISGVVYSARDAAHRRMARALGEGQDLPFDPVGQIIYYMGPSPPPPGEVVGAAGPTTSGRMDVYAPALYAAGIRATMGKGRRSQAVRNCLVEHCAVYLAAIGGAGALLSRCIVEVETIAYADLGPEAVRRLVVRDFPAIVANDAHGADIYEMARSGS